MCITLGGLREEIMEKSEELTNFAVRVRDLSKLGLDQRAADCVFVGDDYIAVFSHSDRTMQYYGGFEYVDKEHRVEAGGYVFYSTEDERVRSHYEAYKLNTAEPEICATCNGSGEGMYDGTRCSSCHGTGTGKGDE